MKKNKLKLKNLQVKSFVTEEKEVKGGFIRITVLGCRTLVGCTFLTCPSQDVPCYA